MTQVVSSPRLPNSDEVNLKQVFTVLRRQALPLLLAPLLVGGATYLLSSRQPPTYESLTSVMAAPPDPVGSTLGNASVTASQLPQGAVAEVLHSRSTVNNMVARVGSSSLPAEVKASIIRDLQLELADGSFQRVSVKARLDTQQRGVYELRASAETPAAARVLASAATSALLDWDLQRARQGVSRARQNLQLQLQNLNSRLAALPTDSVEAQSLTAARGQLVLNLSQATVLEQGANGALTLLAEANAPRTPVSPKPRRDAALATLLTLFAGTGLALLLDSLRRRVRSSADLLALGVPALGEMPRLPRAHRGSMVEAARNGTLYEPTGFLRVNLTGLLPKEGAMLAVTSARPGEGKSMMVASLATAFAMSGKRVLILDLDLHRPTQHTFWGVGGKPWVALPGAGAAQQTNIVQALEHPEHASALDLGQGIHLLPAGEAGRHVAAVLNRPSFGSTLRHWASGYDVVLIDTPPVFSIADAFVVAPHTDGLVVVVESGQTSVPDVQRVVQSARTAQTNLLGTVVNKVSGLERGYSYRYT